MDRLIRQLMWALVGAALFVATAAGATNRTANCAGYCLYTASYGDWSFDGQFHPRGLHAPAARPWLRLSNTVDWKLKLGSSQLAGTTVTAEIHLGTPHTPRRLLAVLCAPCRSGSHGTFRVSDKTLAAIFTGTMLGSQRTVHAYVVLRSSKVTLRRQLSDA